MPPGITQLATEEEHTGKSEQVLNLSAWKWHTSVMLTFHWPEPVTWPYLPAKGLTSMIFPVIRRKVKWFVKHITLSPPQKETKPHSLLRRKERKQHSLIWGTKLNAKNFAHTVFKQKKLMNQMPWSPFYKWRNWSRESLNKYLKSWTQVYLTPRPAFLFVIVSACSERSQ